MDKKLLRYMPEYYICPYCGNLHDWKEATCDKMLGYYEFFFKADLRCYKLHELGYKICFDDDNLYYNIRGICSKVSDMEGRIPIYSIVQKSTIPMVVFNVEVTTRDFIGRYDCIYCRYHEDCYYPKLGEHIKKVKLELGFVFNESEYRLVQQECE